MKPLTMLAICAALSAAAAPLQALGAAGFIVQPAAEKARQKLAPVSNDPFWAELGKTPVRADLAKGQFTAAPTVEVKMLAGQELSVTGFMLPLDPSPMFNHFLLTRNTPVCPFCPPGEPNEVIEVYTTGFVKAASGQVTVRGRFSLQDNAQQGLFFRLDGARVS